jgi:hypothetical protein
MAIGQDAPDHRPEDCFLGEGVRENQSVDVQEHQRLMGAPGLPEPMQQPIEPDVILLLAGEHASGSAQGGLVLLG